MKLTMKKLAQIIREETAHVLKEGYKQYSDEDRWWDNADVPRPGTGESELENAILNDPGMGFTHVVEAYFARPDVEVSLESLDDFDKEHVMALVTGLKDGTIEEIIEDFNTKGGDYKLDGHLGFKGELKSMIDYSEKAGAYGKSQANSSMALRTQRRKKMQGKLDDLRYTAAGD